MVELNVKDMTCGHCVNTVTRAVKALDPQAEVQVDLASKRVRVDGARGPDELIRALANAGYSAVLAEGRAPRADARKGCCGCA